MIYKGKRKRKFGLVRDVFIPQKRRKVTDTRFGFVRFDCLVAANVAIQKANGLWVDDKALVVKFAEFGKENEVNAKENLNKAVTIVRVMEEGNGWLYESVIIRLTANFCVHDLKEELKKKGVEGVLVKDGGGRDVVVRFNSAEDMKSNLHLFYPWINIWSEYMTEWKSGLQLEQER
ncbi:hypothetical protein ACSBR1_035056 [Camellia fascicularis]